MNLARLLRFEHRRVLPPLEAYALWADTYPPRPHNPLMASEQAAVEPIIRMIRPLRALDVGTGTGRYASILADAGAELIVGVDLSMAMLQRNTSGRPRICSDACGLPFIDESFDVVCSSLMVGDLEGLGGWITAAARVLRPRSHLVYSDFHPSWAERGLRRTFRTADGRKYELPYFPHSVDDHVTHLEHAGFVVKAIREPRLGDGSGPAVIVFHAVKSGRTADRSLCAGTGAPLSTEGLLSPPERLR